MMLINVPSLSVISMTMPPGLYNTINIAQWSATVVSQEATKRCHQASARAVLPQAAAMVIIIGVRKKQHTTKILPNN
jgi:hypothetical protein